MGTHGIKDFTLKKMIRAIIKTILLLLLEIYFFSFLLMPLLTRHYKTASYKYASYDVELKGAMHSYVGQLKESGNVKKTLEIGLLTFPFMLSADDKKYENGHCYFINEVSLDVVVDILIPRKLFIAYDENIIKEAHAILISEPMSDILKVSSGDTIDTMSGKYQVAGIYEGAVFNMHFDALILQNEPNMQNQSDFVNNYVYIEFEDKEKGIQGIKNSYFNQGLAFERYGDKWAEKVTQDEKEQFKSASYKIRAVSLAGIEDKLKYNRLETIVHVSIALILIMTVQLYDNHKVIQFNLKKIAVQRVCGYAKRGIFSDHFFPAFISQLILFVMAVLITGNERFVFKHIPAAVLLEWVPIILVCNFIVSLLIGVFAVRETGDAKLMTVLQSEA